MRTITALALLLAAAFGAHGSVIAADASPLALPSPIADPEVVVNPVCLQAFEMADANAAATATTPATVEALEPSGSAAPATTGANDHLDDTIRACASLGEWTAAALLYPDAVGDIELLRHLQDRCADTMSGLDVYGTCRSLGSALAEPEPDAGVLPTQSAEPTPASTIGRDPVAVVPSGSGPPTTGPAVAVKRNDGQLRLPRKLRATVPGATEIRYFDIAGRTAPDLVKQTLRRSAAHCRVHNALACVDLVWRVQTSRTRTATSCTVSSAAVTLTSVVYLPRWSAPDRVDAKLLRWWRRVLSDSARHEAQHIKILQAELDRLREALVARPCAAVDRLIDRARQRSTRAQAAFDRRESAKPLPPLP